MRINFARLRKYSPKPKQLRKLLGRRMVAVPLITIGVLLTLSCAVYLVASRTDKLPPVHDAKIVIISHDKQQQVVPTKERTVGQLLKKLNLKLNEGDVVEPAMNAVINQDQYRINIYRAVPVEIVDGDRHTFGFSASRTPRAIAQQAGTSLYPEDDTTTEPVQDFIRTGAIGEQVIVKRATPINVDLYGTKLTLRTQAKTVAGLIKEKNIKLIPKDQVVPARDTPITPGQQIAFIRTGVKTETVNEDIPMPVQNINDPSLAYGTNAVRQQGTPGQRTVTYQVTIVNNIETGRTVIQEVVSRQPVTQIVVRGTNLSGIKGDMALAGISPNDYNYVDYIFQHESHWNPAALNGSGCAGLGQACPGSKLAAVCPNWQYDPICQIRFFNGYAIRTYGSWAAAYNTKINRGWW